MAAVDYKIKDNFNEKRGVSVLTANIKPADVTTDEGFAAAGTIAVDDVITIANLPDNSVVIGAEIQVIVGPTTGTQQIAIEVGGTEVMAAVALGTGDNVTKGSTTKKKVSGAVTLTNTVADLVDGEIEVLIRYIEPDLGTGNTTNT